VYDRHVPLLSRRSKRALPPLVGECTAAGARLAGGPERQQQVAASVTPRALAATRRRAASGNSAWRRSGSQAPLADTCERPAGCAQRCQVGTQVTALVSCVSLEQACSQQGEG